MVGPAATSQRLPGLAVVLLALAAALPPLIARYPAMTDFPAHLAAWHVWLEGSRNPVLTAHYAADWHLMPNLGAELLASGLAPLVGVEAAGRIIVIVIPALSALSLLSVEWALRRKTGPGSLLALTTIWSPALLMGFLNFALSLALAGFAFAGWILLEGQRWRPLLYLLIAPLVWLCHLAGWGVLGVLVFGYEWQRAGLLRAVLRTTPLWPPALGLLAGGTGGAGLAIYGDGVMLDKLSNWIMGMRDQVQGLDMLTVAALAAAPLIALRARRADGRVGRAALILALLTFVMPRFLGGGDFADYRLVPVALAFGCLAIDLPASRTLMLIALIPFLIRLGVTTAAWERHSRETATVLEAVDHIPRGAIVAGAYAEDAQEWAQPVNGHVFAYATVRRDALTNSDFAITGVHLLRHRDGDDSFTDPSQRLLLPTGTAPDLAGFGPARKAQYLWYAGPRLPRTWPAGAVPVFINSQTVLLRLANSRSSR